jgi:hypothetical protein
MDSHAEPLSVQGQTSNLSEQSRHVERVVHEIVGPSRLRSLRRPPLCFALTAALHYASPAGSHQKASRAVRSYLRISRSILAIGDSVRDHLQPHSWSTESKKRRCPASTNSRTVMNAACITARASMQASVRPMMALKVQGSPSR